MCKSGNYEHKSTNLKQTVMNKCQELLSAKINKNRILTMQFVFYMVTKKWGKEWISNKAGQEFVHIPCKLCSVLLHKINGSAIPAI